VKPAPKPAAVVPITVPTPDQLGITLSGPPVVVPTPNELGIDFE
jgi:hypothetical protein